MIGRAGRPGFDTSGMAVIMTDNKSKATFQRLAASGLPLAYSQLMQRLEETMNAEISQRVICSVDGAVNWLKGTLYCTQLKKDPSRHGISDISPECIERHILNICESSIQRLEAVGALTVKPNRDLFPLVAGHVMVSRNVS